MLRITIELLAWRLRGPKTDPRHGTRLPTSAPGACLKVTILPSSKDAAGRPWKHWHRDRLPCGKRLLAWDLLFRVLKNFGRSTKSTRIPPRRVDLKLEGTNQQRNTKGDMK